MKTSVYLPGTGTPFAIMGLTTDAAGCLLVATSGGGLFAVDTDGPEVLRHITTGDGLPTDTLYSCCIDSSGHLWLGTATGLMRYTPGSGCMVLLDQSLGLPDDDCNSQRAVT